MSNYLPSPIVSEQYSGKKKERSSNLELYRIIVMLMIVAHHYVVNSGLLQAIESSGVSQSNFAMLIFGAWGKTGINCFIFITGYFMCKSNPSWHKLLKLYLQIVFFSLAIYAVFSITGNETFEIRKILLRLRPVWEFKKDFVSCFMMFYLFIPFINILIKHLGRSQHLVLMALLLTYYSILPSFPGFKLDFNYVGWFSAVYVIAAYFRLYAPLSHLSTSTWGLITFCLVLFGAFSIISIEYIYKLGIYKSLYVPYFFISDSNKLLSIAIATSSFMFFNGLKIPHSRLINTIGGTTFGVLLIHANSNAMRTWLWQETVDCVGNFKDDAIWTVGYAVGCVLIIFIVCSGIDWFRGRFIEPYLIAGVKKVVTPLSRKVTHLTKKLTIP